MPFDGTPRRRPSTEEISRAYENLVRLEHFFDGGLKWHKRALSDGHGSFCLIGAIDHLRCGDLALRYLNRVARTRHERCGGSSSFAILSASIVHPQTLVPHLLNRVA